MWAIRFVLQVLRFDVAESVEVVLQQGFESDFADEVQFPLVTAPDYANVLHLIEFRKVNTRTGVVLAEEEVRPVFFEVRAFRETRFAFAQPTTVPDAGQFGYSGEPQHGSH